MSTVKLSGEQTMLVTWVGLGLVGAVVLYFVVKYGLPKLAGGAASGAADTLNAVNQGLGNNDLTTSQTDFGGSSVDYSGHGVVSTLGAEANAISGGTLASAGEGIGGALFNWWNPNAAGAGVTYIVQFPDGSKHAVNDTSIDGNSQFSYGGVRYKFGTVDGQHTATPVYTGTGV
jgi:hypothetical protein